MHSELLNTVLLTYGKVGEDEPDRAHGVGKTEMRGDGAARRMRHGRDVHSMEPSSRSLSHLATSGDERGEMMNSMNSMTGGLTHIP